MAHPDNRYRGLEGLSREEKASRRRQNQLFIHLNKTITTSTLQDIKQLVSGVYLEDGELERCNTMSDILKALDNRSVITVGHYEKLKELLEDAGVKKIVKYVEKAEHDIEEISRRALRPREVYDDDPGYVKALKEHYVDICTALLDGSTLANVTDILKRHKILDEQQPIRPPTLLAARELLYTVLNKRNKGLRAMRVLALALCDAGHEKLGHNILTTHYSRGRRAGRDVWIPSSMMGILSSYLDITEKLIEPGLHRVLDHLVNKGKVSEDERATILQQPSRVEKVQEMLDTLLSGDREEVWWTLMDALRHAGQGFLACSMAPLRPREVYDDDPGYVKALKEHYVDICTALQEGSSLANVTDILKRNKILDEQQPIRPPTLLAARELLYTVLNKRNKGLRAMRVLALALCDAGHEKLGHNILTTRYSRGRRAGRDVWIPSSMKGILSSYLDITEKLPEPELHRVLDHLVSKGKVSEDERATILQQPSRVEKVQEMLDTLLSGNREGAGRALANALIHAGQVDLTHRLPYCQLSWRLLGIHISIGYKKKWPFTYIYRDTGLDVRREQPLPRVSDNERVTSWKASDSEHGELLKTAVCGQWALSSDKPGQREWRGHKAVIDVETVEEILGEHSRKRKQTVLETLASIPDVPESSLFILNAMKRPDLKTKWGRLLSGECFLGAKVLLIEGSDGKASPQDAVKRNVEQAYNLAKLRWSLLEKVLSECYRDKVSNLSISDRLADLLSRNRSQTTTLPHMTPDERVVPWPAIDFEHGELVKIVICWQWANSSNKPGQREWGGHKAVIDLEILDDISGESKETVLKVLDVIPDETLFILNTMKRPDLRTKWSPLLSGKLFHDAKVLLIVESDGKGMSHGGMKRKQDSTETSGESTEDCSAKKQRNTTLGTQTEATGVDPSKGKQCTIS